jgi:uncharacterized protein (TIGR02270 family)
MTRPDITPEQHIFTTALCKEHLDEAAFLYAQCRHLLSGAAGPWPNAQRFEQRLAAHLDALMIEGQTALDACMPRMDSTDPGDLYTATRIFCRSERNDLAGRILDNLAPENENKFSAVCSALVHEARINPQQVLDILAAHPAQLLATATVAADARLNDAWPLVTASLKQPARTLARVARLCGRIHNTGAVHMLTQALDHQDRKVRHQAALALLRLGNAHDVIQHARSLQTSVLAIGLAGGPSEAAFLIGLAKSAPITRDIVTSLGLLGEISALTVLIEALDRKELSESAALALELITGAGLKENLFIPDPLNPKALFKEELEKHEQGESPYPPGKTPGVATDRLSQNPDHWRQWIDENHRRFSPGTRYRNGSPYCPQGLIETLQSPAAPQWIRQLAYEEMVIRYQKDIPFEAHWPASFQIQAIEAYQHWSKTQHTSFDPGRWYFAGRRMT